MMTLYYTPGACSLIVRIIINELSIKAQYQAVNLRTKKTDSDLD
jgi:glutathione S-transferase